MHGSRDIVCCASIRPSVFGDVDVSHWQALGVELSIENLGHHGEEKKNGKYYEVDNPLKHCGAACANRKETNNQC